MMRYGQRRIIDLSSEAVVMGVLNVTPDSFSDGGEFIDIDKAVLRAREMVGEGAKIIDIGGESTRPGARVVGVAEEVRRVLPVVAALRGLAEFDDVYLSVDTTKAEVAEVAIDAGVDIVNDVSGFISDPAMGELCARAGVGMVVMHMQGTPETMQDDPRYDDVVGDVEAFFRERLGYLAGLGVREERVCFDPGIGFGKTDDDNLSLLADLGRLHVGGRPLLLGVSRKSLFGRLLGAESIDARDLATVAVTSLARQQGCMLHRVHEVRGNYDALRMAELLLGSGAEVLT